VRTWEAIRVALLIVAMLVGVVLLVTLLGRVLGEPPRRPPLLLETVTPPCMFPGGALDVAPELTWRQLC
jgi:hypothetical protein